jgi:hypothetical protein
VSNRLIEGIERGSLRDAIPLREVPPLLPRLRNGKPVHVGTVYRWCLRGVRGRRLRHFRVGHQLCITRADLAAFLGDDGAAERGEGHGADPKAVAPRDPAVDAQLDRLGL